MTASLGASGGLRFAVFDVDGTLADSQHNIVAAMEEAFAALSLDPPPAEAVRAIIGLSLPMAVARLLAPQDPQSIDSALVDRLSQAYRDAFFARRSRPDFDEPLFPGARPVLEGLRDSGVLLGLATGKSARGVLVFLERHDLAGLIDVWRSADDGPGKPDPWMLRSAMDALGCAPAETVMIGDTTYDMDMARGAGAGALGVSWGSHRPDQLRAAGARAIADRMTDIPALLEPFWPLQQEPTA